MQIHVFDPIPGRPGEAERERSFGIRPGRDGIHQLTLEGPLPPRWIVGLFRGLATAGLDVSCGVATRRGDADWKGTFEIRRPAGALDPLTIDVLALATGTPPTRDDALALTGYRLRESRRHGGCLDLEVRGPDRVGFLGGLLTRLAFLTLVPVEMRVWTDARGVQDRLSLHRSDGRHPDARCRRLLREVLDGRLLR